MKKIVFLALISIFLLSFIGCGGGAGSSSEPRGEKPDVPFFIELRPSEYIAQTNSFIYIRARVLNGNGNPIDNIAVRFTNLSTVGNVSTTSSNTNNLGFAEVTLSSKISGFSTIQAETKAGESVVRDRRTVFFTAQNILAVRMNMDVDSVPGNGVFNERDDLNLFNPPPTPDDTVEILATVLDAGGVRAPGQSVTWSADHTEVVFLRADEVTNVFGEAKAIVKVVPESLRDTDTNVNIMAFAGNGAASMVTLFLEPVVVESITVSANPQTVNSGDTSTITANVITTAGTPVPDGTTVNFKITSGSGGIDPFAQTTNGIATAEFTAPSTPNTCTVTASIGGVSGTANVLVTTALTVQPATQTISGVTSGTAIFRIYGGISPYTVASSNTLFPATLSGKQFTVSVPAGSLATTVTYTVRDSAGMTATAILTITSLPSTITITPDKFDIGSTVGGSVDVQYFVSGGKAPYTVYFTLPMFVDGASPTQDSDTVGTNGTNQAVFTVRYTWGVGDEAKFQFIVVDSLGSTKSSDVTLTP